MNIPPRRRPWTLAILAGCLYGLTIRFGFFYSAHNRPLLTQADRLLPNAFWVMTAGFVIFVPLAMGWITTFATPSDGKSHWGVWIFGPWLAMLLADAIVLLAGLEGFICLIFALPITLICASIGGITAGLVQQSRFRRKGAATLCLAVLPLLLSAVEMQFNGPLETRTVQTSVLIHAPTDTVWHNIERVRAIRPDELDLTWAHRIGFPLPVEATLSHEGVGGVRNASFEGGLVFLRPSRTGSRTAGSASQSKPTLAISPPERWTNTSPSAVASLTSSMAPTTWNSVRTVPSCSTSAARSGFPLTSTPTPRYGRTSSCATCKRAS